MQIDASVTFLVALGLFAIVMVVFAMRRTVDRFLIALTALSFLLIAVSLTQLAFELFAAGHAYLPGGGRGLRTVARASFPVAFWVSTICFWAATAAAWMFGGWLLRIVLMRSQRK